MIEVAGMAGEFEIWDERFRHCIVGNAWVERLHTGMRWTEGPVYFADGDYLLWSDIPNNRMMRWVEGGGVSVFRQPSNNSNGNTRDRQGRLVTCEHGARRVTRTEPNGVITVLCDSYRGKRLNSPNDVVVKSDGSVWFTDPPYGILSDYEGNRGELEYGGSYVFRLDVDTGSLEVLADDFDKPNGIAFSPDERVLYVTDSGANQEPGSYYITRPHHIKAFDVTGGTRLRGERLFAVVTPGFPDGLKVDRDGRVYASAFSGVQIFNPSGQLLGEIHLPGAVNFCFGGAERDLLLITTDSAVWAAALAAKGA